MAIISITSYDGKLNSASAVLEVSTTNPEYNQPALRIKQAGEYGGAALIRIDDPNPDIEFVETDHFQKDPAVEKNLRTCSRSESPTIRFMEERRIVYEAPCARFNCASLHARLRGEPPCI